MEDFNPVELEKQQQATYSRYHRLLTVFERLLALNAIEAANTSGRCTDAKLTDIKSVALGCGKSTWPHW
ncbi:MAG TPA: hypothetical protein VKT82_14665 [Ktedonobacterales bacterium]|nr:hypothetical protein [Ktedonobacterales bacterium]